MNDTKTALEILREANAGNAAATPHVIKRMLLSPTVAVELSWGSMRLPTRRQVVYGVTVAVATPEGRIAPAVGGAFTSAVEAQKHIAALHDLLRTNPEAWKGWL